MWFSKSVEEKVKLTLTVELNAQAILESGRVFSASKLTILTIYDIVLMLIMVCTKCLKYIFGLTWHELSKECWNMSKILILLYNIITMHI